MPAAEADNLYADWLAKNMPQSGTARSGAIDWIRFGQLLRDDLGWDDYPEAPGSP